MSACGGLCRTCLKYLGYWDAVVDALLLRCSDVGSKGTLVNGGVILCAVACAQTVHCLLCNSLPVPQTCVVAWNLSLLAFSLLQEKSSHLCAALLGEDCEISPEQLHELLQYAALGKHHNAAQPRYRISMLGRQLCAVPLVLCEPLEAHRQCVFWSFCNTVLTACVT